MENPDLINAPITSRPGKTKITKTLYDYGDALQTVVMRGRHLFGPGFQIFEEDRTVILKLLCWFLQDEAIAQEEGLDLGKGILLTGPRGCGKSAVMRILQSLCTPGWQFVIKSSKRAALEFAEEGYGVISRYSVKSFCLYDIPRTICFDNLGD